MRVIAPALEHPRGSAERAAAVKAAAGMPHLFGGELRRVAERTLYDWICQVEKRGGAAFVTVPRADAGSYREPITRRWRQDCGPASGAQERTAAQQEQVARGLILKGRSDRKVARLAGIELQRLTADAGMIRPKSEADKLCKLNVRWVQRFREMKAARDHMNGHKRFSDKHEYRVSRHLTAEPMEVLYGDVHKVDVKIADAIAPDWASLRSAAKDAKGKGLMTIRVAIIGWMDGSSHYLWATPVILGPGQGITQKDVARSLFEVFSCPHGGIPRLIVIDNGSEYNGTPQEGHLGGLSPKAMLEAKIAQTGWRAQVPDADSFDLVFSREVPREVRQGSVSINRRKYSAPILAQMIGKRGRRSWCRCATRTARPS